MEKFKIKEITICLHCGCSREVVNYQMSLLKPLENEFKIYWNNRIDRHPESYDSFSELINDCIVSSPTEFIIFMNDRTHPKPEEVKHIIYLLENGYAAATKYSVGFMGFSKELIRQIGWWDERYYGGGFEDDDFVLRLRLNDLAYFESLESTYDMRWKTPLQPEDGKACVKSEPFFKSKWITKETEIRQVVEDEKYEKYKDKLGNSKSEISSSWLKWSDSKIGIFFKERQITNYAGPSRTCHFRDENGIEFKKVTSDFKN